jgi:hypothetical protein
MSRKVNQTVFFLGVAVSLTVVLAFQNCAGAKNSGDLSQGLGSVQTSVDMASSKDSSIFNFPQLATYYGTLTQGSEIYGNCQIVNSSRDFVSVVNTRSGKSNCATMCRANQDLFKGDAVSCSLPGGVAVSASLESARNHCVITSEDTKTIMDVYSLDRASCISQCQTLGTGMDKNLGFRCEWQRRLLYYRPSGSIANIPLGSCAVTAKDAKATVIMTLNYASGTTEESCSNSVTKIKSFYSYDDVSYVFTKVDYVVIP